MEHEPGDYVAQPRPPTLVPGPEAWIFQVPGTYPRLGPQCEGQEKSYKTWGSWVAARRE